MFLGKPKDDLRKDARLMDLNAIINKLLKGNSESRRRQLRTSFRPVFMLELDDEYGIPDIRTYGVVTLNEECGFIQWVPNTIPIRPILNKAYDARRVKGWVRSLNSSYSLHMLNGRSQTGDMAHVFAKIKDGKLTDQQCASMFRERVLSVYDI